MDSKPLSFDHLIAELKNNNKVLENCNIDSSKYSGLAFGIGIERIAMLKYGINHMGKLFENDIEFLKQFKA